ncbi:3'-5' exonuclease [Prescottella subtropica]|uniref:3'-5' exonuclease n=1 Tax=Prescottella subtropica TaxID=2545757 RepID=UPI001F50277C|nr:3'-5' exonuclease [Prescottella subtropica]
MSGTEENTVPTIDLTPRQWATRMLSPGAACILDVETTGLDGAIIEIAVIDAATGEVLLDTLVDPGGVPIEPDAHAVHGLTAADLAGAPTWPQVHPRLAAVTAGRTVLAYNAPFDRDRVLHDCRRAGIDPGHLFDPARWQCVMARRCQAAGLGLGGQLRLDGGHRALADVHATRVLLQQLAGGPDVHRTPVVR